MHIYFRRHFKNLKPKPKPKPKNSNQYHIPYYSAFACAPVVDTKEVYTALFRAVINAVVAKADENEFYNIDISIKQSKVSELPGVLAQDRLFWSMPKDLHRPGKVSYTIKKYFGLGHNVKC